MNFDKLSDEKLAQHMQKNNGEGFDVLMNRYQLPLLRYAKRLINDENMSEDAVQNTFISVYQNINSYNPKRPLSSWIYRICHNKAINEIRSQKPHISLESISQQPQLSGQEIPNILDLTTLRKVLGESLELIPLKYKEVIILRFFEGKSYDEISDILKLPISTVGVRIKRGLEKLKITNNDKLKEFL